MGNTEMVAHYAPLIAGQMHLGTDGDDGSSVRLGQGVGALVAHMDAAEAALPSVPLLVYPSLLINQFGQRFINEDTYCGRSGQAAIFHQQARCSLVLDEETYESVAEQDRWGYRPTWVCETVAELEGEMGLPSGSLQATVALYNEHAARGEDPIFHKRAEYCQPLTSPYGAIALTGLPYPTFTLGGLVTTIDGEVVGPDGAAIPGLYAAGRATSGIPSWGYASGTSLGDGTFFGRRAGRAAAAGPPPRQPTSLTRGGTGLSRKTYSTVHATGATPSMKRSRLADMAAMCRSSRFSSPTASKNTCRSVEAAKGKHSSTTAA